MSKTTKNILVIIFCIFASVLISSLVGSLTNGFVDWDFHIVNEKNLISIDNYDSALTAEIDGIDIEVDEDGVITVDGENKGTGDLKIKVADLTLKKGEYTFSSSAKGADDKTYFMSIENGNTVVKADDGEDSTFDVKEEATYTVYITICAGEEIDTTFKPVLVDGDKVGSFYVIG